MDREMDREVTSDQVPGFINTFFTEIGPKLAEGHREPWSYAGVVNNKGLADMETNLEEVMRLCKDLNPMKSSGFDSL